MANQQLITIPKDQMPTQRFAVSLVRPTFQDYSRAWKLFPSETRENPDGPGYSFEDFFCALCLRAPDGKEVDNNPKDAIHRFDEIDLKDKQFVVSTFTSTFFLLQDLQDEAEVLADDLIAADASSLSYTLLQHQLPLQSVSFTFNRPSAAVQVYTNKSYTSTSVNGCLFSDLLFLNCLSHINGEEVDVANTKNVLGLVYDYDLLDVQYAAQVFLKMFALDPKERQRSSELGKSLRANLLPQSPSTKFKSAFKEKEASPAAQPKA